MNRKLLNGLLVLAVATGGVGTFTSCKDDDFQNKVLIDQIDLSDQIQAIRDFSDDAFVAALYDWLKNNPQAGDAWLKWANDYTGQNAKGQFTDFPDFVQKAAAMYSAYKALLSGNYADDPNAQAIVNGLYNFINNKIQNEEWVKNILQDIKNNAAGITDNANKISQLQKDIIDIAQALTDLNNGQQGLVSLMESLLDLYQNNLAQQVTSITINQTTNPVFGSINLPLGINSTVLATYQYNGKTMQFPAGVTIQNLAGGATTEYNFEALQYAFDEIQKLSQSSSVTAQQYAFTAPESATSGNMGSVFTTINPVGNDFSGIELSIVNAKGETIIDNLKATAYDGDLYFGISRAENDVTVYEVAVDADLEKNASKLAFDFKEKGAVKDALLDFFRNRSVSDVAEVGKVIYESMKDFLPAYALQVAYKVENGAVTRDGEEEEGGVDIPEIGDVPGMGTTTTTKKVLSKFELAATIITPLAYTEPLSDLLDKGHLLGKQIPAIDPITEYINKIKNKLNFRIDTGIELKEFEIKLTYTGKGTIKVEVISNDGSGDVIGTAELPYGSAGPQKPQEGDPDYEAKMKAYEQSLNAFIDELLADMQDQVNGAVNDYMTDLKTQLNDILGQVDKVNAKLESVQDYLDRLEGSKKVEYAQKVVNKLNQVIAKVNDFLANPDKYLQVMMAYNAGDGVHHASETAEGAVTVNVPAIGDINYILNLFVSSYTGDVVVPSFKKYVAITKVMNDPNANLADLNEKAGLNKVIEGSELSIPMSVRYLGGLGVVQLTYVSLDYRGNVSAQNYYFNFK